MYPYLAEVLARDRRRQLMAEATMHHQVALARVDASANDRAPIPIRRVAVPPSRPILPDRRQPLKYVLFYDSAPDVASKAPVHYPAHRTRLEAFHNRGTLLMIGTFANAQGEGAIAIFTTRDAAEEFATEDPFVLNGVVAHWHIREWNEVLAVS